MKKVCLLLLAFIGMSMLGSYADSPCDSEVNMPKKSSCGCPCHKSAQNYGYNKQYAQQYNQQYNQYYNKSCNEPCQKQYSTPCNKPCSDPCDENYSNTYGSECFLCTNRNIDELFNCMNLSETQLCTAMKIQDKYELEVLSLNERIQCEEQKIYALKQNCAKKSEIRNVNRTIKDLKKKRKEICKCYEKQFKAILSDSQIKAYKRAKK